VIKTGFQRIEENNYFFHFAPITQRSSVKGLGPYFLILNTDYGHKKSKSLILCGPNPNKYLECGYKDLFFGRNTGQGCHQTDYAHQVILAPPDFQTFL
jgi:hypothetical protein